MPRKPKLMAETGRVGFDSRIAAWKTKLLALSCEVPPATQLSPTTMIENPRERVRYWMRTGVICA